MVPSAKICCIGTNMGGYSVFGESPVAYSMLEAAGVADRVDEVVDGSFALACLAGIAVFFVGLGVFALPVVLRLCI